jgi:hypothetical protein
VIPDERWPDEAALEAERFAVYAPPQPPRRLASIEDREFGARVLINILAAEHRYTARRPALKAKQDRYHRRRMHARKLATLRRIELLARQSAEAAS